MLLAACQGVLGIEDWKPRVTNDGGAGGTGGLAGVDSGGQGAGGAVVATGGTEGGGGGAGNMVGTGGSASGGTTGTGGMAGSSSGASGGVPGDVDGGGTVTPGTVGTVGEPCSSGYGCEGTNQRKKLVCMNEVWQANGECSTSERCDTRETNAGACEPVAAECVGKSPGDPVCSQRERVACGLDLVTLESLETCAGGCVDGACTECQPAEIRCSGNAVQTCDATGHWGTAAACPSATPHCSSGSCGAAPSCQGLLSNCGPATDQSCCTSLSITGGAYDRSNDASYPATVSDFRLDKFEVTVGRFQKFVDAVVGGWLPWGGSGKHTHRNNGSGLVNSGGSGGFEQGWDSSWNTDLYADQATWDLVLSCNESDYTTWKGLATRPTNCISWYQAYAFCIWDGGFLPSEAEWNYAAAGGSNQRIYPWGPTAPGANADLTVYGCYYGGGTPGQCYSADSIAWVGSVPAGNGRYGQSDLAGNVFEWNLDWYSSSYAAQCDDCANLESASYRVMRGGAFASAASDLPSSMRDYAAPADPSSHRTGLGVRCARIP